MRSVFGFFRGASIVALALVSASAFAATGIEAALTVIDLDGVATLLGGVMLVLIAIYLTVHGMDIARGVVHELDRDW